MTTNRRQRKKKNVTEPWEKLKINLDKRQIKRPYMGITDRVKHLKEMDIIKHNIQVKKGWDQTENKVNKSST